MRANYKNALELSEKIRGFHIDFTRKDSELYGNLGQFKRYLDASAMRYGLTHLPNEVLCEILLRVARDLKSTVKLSHVCRRFRSTITSCRVFWKDFRLTSTWTPEQVQAFAELCKFQELKVTIIPRNRDSPILTETVKAIFKLHEHIEDLYIESADSSQIGKIQRYLQRRGMPKLWSLHLRRIQGAGETFEGFCEMPSLGSLSSDFLPHVSLARSLFRCTLALTKPHVPELLEFLASTSFLRELFLEIIGDKSFEVTSCKHVSLHRLQFLTFRASVPYWFLRVIMEKLKTPAVHKFTLALANTDNSGFGNIFKLVQSRPSIRVLELEMCSGWHNQRLDVALIPPDIERLTLSGSWQGQASLASPEAFRARRLKWLKFERFKDLCGVTVLSFRNVFVRSGHDEVLFLLKNCQGFHNIWRFCKDEVYELHELESAVIKR